MIFLCIIFNDMNVFSFASSFASSFAENQTCKRNNYLVNQALIPSIFAFFFADSFAENQTCKERSNVIY